MSESLPESLIPADLPDPADLEPAPARSASDPLASRLANRVAIVTDGASGLGQAVAVAFARQGATVVFSWLNEHEDAAETVALIDDEGGIALSIPGDIGNPDFATELVRQTVATFGRIDILVNNAAEQLVCDSFEDIPQDQVERSFRTNILSQFWLAKAALPHMEAGSCIINAGAAGTPRDSATCIDYAASKAAVIGFTESLALHLAGRAIRVNAVAPNTGAAIDDTTPSYVFLASQEAASLSGQVLRPGLGK